MSGTLLAFGYGYTARALARRLLPKGWRIIGTTRDEGRAARMAQEGVEGLVFDGATPGRDVPAALERASHVLVSAGPDADGDPVLRHHRADIAAARHLAAIAYLSTTAVYGDHGGGIVDEETPLRSDSARGRRRIEAESAWFALGRETGIPVMALRLGGIYGPGRSPLDAVRAGTARRIVKPGQVFNRIHVDDIAAVLEAALEAPRAGRAYNVVDDEPAPPQEVVAFAAELVGLPPPPEVAFEAAGLSPMGVSFYSENKRVRNARIKAELGVTLAYPTYREGLRGLI